MWRIVTHLYRMNEKGRGTLERWKDVKGYEGIYKVSDLGRVWSCERIDERGVKRKGKFLKPSLNQKGFLYIVLLDNKSKAVHRLVAEAFVENEEGKPYAIHLNGIKTDNRAVNLKWLTYQENVKHASDMGFWSIPKGEESHNAVLTNEQANAIRIERANTKMTLAELAKKYSVSVSTIHKVVKWKTYREEI